MLAISTSRRRYVAASYERSGLEIKQAQRQRLVDYCYRHFRDVDGYIKVLTLPGPWLHFEHMLIKPKPRTWKPKFTCCENNRTLFAAMAVKVPVRGNNGLKVTHAAELQCDVVTNRKDFICLHCDVQDFLQTRPGVYRVVWLDFCSQITTKMLQALSNLPQLIADGPCLFALTVLLAREEFSVLRRIDEEADGDRMKFVRNLCLSLIPNSELIHSQRYVERSSPMAHVIVGRQ